jgi:hypothetical protein
MSPAIAAPNPRQPVAGFDPLHKAGFFLLCIYFFVTYSRVLDIAAPRLHIPMMLTLVLYALTAFAGGIQSSFATLPGKLFVAITVWMIIGIPFSVWPGGVIDNLTTSWLKVLPIFFTVVGLVVTTGECIRLVRWVAFALLTMVIIALVHGDTTFGRLIIEDSRFSDPNDLSLMCLIGIALWCAALNLSQNTFFKIAALGSACIVFYAIVRTGSRGALLGLITMFMFMFLKSPHDGKTENDVCRLSSCPADYVYGSPGHIAALGNDVQQQRCRREPSRAWRRCGVHRSSVGGVSEQRGDNGTAPDLRRGAGQLHRG